MISKLSLFFLDRHQKEVDDLTGQYNEKIERWCSPVFFSHWAVAAIVVWVIASECRVKQFNFYVIDLETFWIMFP